MRTAVFGGSFNPPHSGHVRAALAAMEVLGAERLIVIPTSVSPHKPQPEASPSPEDRLALTRMAFQGCPGVEVSDIEICRGGKSYTVDTLEQLSSQNMGEELLLLMGADMLLCFDSAWKDFRRILELASLAVFRREKECSEELEKKRHQLCREYGAVIELLPISPFPASSTEIRAMLPRREGADLLPPEVYSEIIRRRFYGAKPGLVWLREQVEPYLDEKRIPHVMGCAREAVSLALRWGGDPEDAAEAGLLHDITKREKEREQLKLCDKYGIITDSDEKDNYKLLHSKTGAALARELFGIDDVIYGAICWHTTGRPNMSLLEKIIYMADYIEPNRSFPGVDELRELAYRDLDGAMALGLEMSIEDLARRGVRPHVRSISALEYFRGMIS